MHHDLGTERPGDPEADGCWETACQLVRDYQFAAPEIIRAVYRPSAALLGRDMLLEGRFLGLRFLMGVRVTEVVDTRRATSSWPPPRYAGIRWSSSPPPATSRGR